MAKAPEAKISKITVPALAEKYTQSIELKVKDLQQRGQIDIPNDYSVANALRSAYLILQEVEDKNHKPALEVCTPTSIENALLEMVTTGLNPAKNQGYFLIYGNKLVFQRSYFGSISLAKRARPEIKDIVCEPVYTGDSITIKIVKGKKVVEEHQQTLESISGEKIRGGYAMAIDHNGEILQSIIMTIDEVKQSWRQSKMYPLTDKGEIKPGTTHKKFTSEMVRRTIINRLCKEIINTSSDQSLLRKIHRADGENAATIVEATTATLANAEVIDILPEPAEPEVVKSSKPKPEREPEKTVPEFTDQAIEPDPEPESEPETDELKPNPEWVSTLVMWLREVKDNKKNLAGRMDNIRADSFPRLCESDRAEVEAVYQDMLKAPAESKKAKKTPPQQPQPPLEQEDWMV